MSSLRWRVVLLCVCLTSHTVSHPGITGRAWIQEFQVAVYVPEYVVEQMKDPNYLQSTWETISGQVKIDKVYLETYRSGRTADDASLDQVKAFFVEREWKWPEVSG